MHRLIKYTVHDLLQRNTFIKTKVLTIFYSTYIYIYIQTDWSLFYVLWQLFCSIARFSCPAVMCYHLCLLFSPMLLSINIFVYYNIFFKYMLFYYFIWENNKLSKFFILDLRVQPSLFKMYYSEVNKYGPRFTSVGKYFQSLAITQRASSVQQPPPTTVPNIYSFSLRRCRTPRTINNSVIARNRR